LNKRAGALVLTAGVILLGLFAYGGYQRQKLQQAVVRDTGPKNVTPATAAGSEILKAIPEGGSATLSRNPGSPGPGKPEPRALDRGAGARPTADRVAPPANYQTSPVPYPAPNDPVRPPSPEEQARIAAYARHQEALTAPTSFRQASASAWPPETVRSNSAADGLATLLSSAANRAASDRNDARLGQGMNRSSEYDDQNMQAGKEQFIRDARLGVRSDNYLKSVRAAPVSAFEIKAGWEIPAVMEQALNSDLPGEVKALVSSSVFDTATGQHLLIPQGSRLVGAYDSRIGYSQDGVQVVWNRIIFPDASSIDLAGMSGTDAYGNAGLRDQVDHHYRRLIGFTALTSLFSAGFALSQRSRQSVLAYPNPGEIAGSAVGQEVSQLGSHITRRNLNVQPTIRIPVGYRFNVRVNRDILFDGPYRPIQAAQ
jgi:type IV secretion system protein VirB10